SAEAALVIRSSGEPAPRDSQPVTNGRPRPAAASAAGRMPAKSCSAEPAGRGAVRDTTRNHGPAIPSPKTGIVVTVCAYQLDGPGATRHRHVRRWSGFRGRGLAARDGQRRRLHVAVVPLTSLAGMRDRRRILRREGPMARTSLMRALQHLAWEHRAASQLGIGVEELREREQMPGVSRREFLKVAGAAGAAAAVAGPLALARPARA